MAISYSATVRDVVQESFNLLRQDYTAPNATNADIDAVPDTSLEWSKAKLSIKTASNEVFDSFDWGSGITSDGITTWPAKMRNALVYVLARELAIPIAGRVEDLKIFAQLSSEKLLVAQIRALNDKLVANTDPILSSLLSNFRTDDPGLIRAYSVYTNRSSIVKTESDKEVKETLGLTTLDNLAQQASNALSVYKLANACGLDANTAQLRLQEYKAKIQEWRKLKLERERTSDAVLDQLVGAFKGDDETLCNSWTTYTTRKTATLTACENAVKIELGVATLDNLASAAANTLAVAKLSAAFGIDGSMQMAEYEKMITELRQKQLTAIVDAKSSSAGLYLDCLNEVKKTLGLVSGDTEYTTPDALMVAAAQCLCYAKMGESYRYDANFTATKLKEYEAKIAEWLKVKLDTIASEAVTNSSPSSGLLKDSIDEVKNTLGITVASTFASDGLAVSCARSLCYAKYGQRYGYDANFVQIKTQEYATKIQEWRKIKLNTSLETNSDPVLTELLWNFKSDDAGLANAFAVYTQRVANVKVTSESEINLSHDWRTAFDWDATTVSSHPAYAAWIALCASKLAPACGMDSTYANLLEQKYQLRLKEARVADLEAAKNAITDADTKDILSQILCTFSSADARLPRSISSLTDRIANLTDNAKKEVLLAHDWNFASVTEHATSTECPEFCHDDYRWSCPFPRKALRLVSVHGPIGKLNEWKIENGMILAKDPITKIKYVKDVTDLAKWAPLARPLYAMRLKALVARTISGNTQDESIQEQLYAKALADAKLNDARETNVPDDAWADNNPSDGDMRRCRRFPFDNIFRR